MSGNPFIYAGGGLLLLGIVFEAFRITRSHKKDFREYLEPDLRKCGAEFLSAVYPGMFKVGPFPKFETEFGRPQSIRGGTRGEYNEYSIVSFRDSEGRTYRLWALLEFECFELRRVRWRAEEQESLPLSVLPILTN
jgi:hypothetical protein